MSRFESAPGAEVSDEDDLSLTSQDYFEVANALKQKGGRKAASPETRARRAEERRQSRRAALRDAALAVPEKVTVLESRVWKSYLTPWSKDGDGGHTALASRSAAECLIAGYNESLDHDVAVRTSGSKHVLTGVNPSLSDTRIVSICADPKCRYTFAFTTEPPKKADKDGRWHLEKFTPHSARCAVPARARARKCHYSGEQLAAVLLESEPEDIFAVEPKAAKRLLNPYIVAKPDDDLAHRAIHASVERLYGKEKDHLKRLPYTIDELSNLDYETSTFTTNCRGMDEIIKMRAQSEHKRRYRHLPKSKRPAFDWTASYKAQVKAPKAKKGETYLVGWTVSCIPTSLAMLDSGLVSRRRVSDFCFGKGVGVGNFGFTVTQDANRHLILLGASWSAYDETRGTWLRHLEPMFEAYGDEHMREEGVVHVVDLQKGSKSALDSLLDGEKGGYYICSQHRGDSAKKRGITKELYQQFSRACTAAKRDKYYNKMTPEARAWVDEVPFACQTILDSPDGTFHGMDDTSNIAESENWSMMPVRQAVSPFHALHVLLLRARDKYEEHRAAAEACTTFATQSAIDHIAKALQYSHDMNPKFVVRSKRDGRVDVYPNPAKPTHYSVDLSLRHRGIDVTCSCEKPQKTHDLCWHCVAAASFLKKDPTRFVFQEDRTSTWKAQYEAGGEFKIPDPPSDEENLEPAPYVKPLAVAAGRGRIKTKRGQPGDAKRDAERKLRRELRAAAAAEKEASPESEVESEVESEAQPSPPQKRLRGGDERNDRVANRLAFAELPQTASPVAPASVAPAPAPAAPGPPPAPAPAPTRTSPRRVQSKRGRA